MFLLRFFFMLCCTAILAIKPTDPLNEYFQNSPGKNLDQKLALASKLFLNKPYALSPLGEGFFGKFNQKPIYSLEEFDCQTYVSTVLALIWSDAIANFLPNMLMIRYHGNHQATYLQRNHFPSIDWLPNAYKLKILTDITDKLYDYNHKPYFKYAKALINKAAWFKNTSKKQLYLPNATKKQITQQLPILKNKAKKFIAINKTIAYIPLDKWLASKSGLNKGLLKLLPNSMVVEHVRLNWQPVKTTAMHISHMGIILHLSKGWVYREASSRLGQVVEEDLLVFINRLQKQKNIAGLHLDQIIIQ